MPATYTFIASNTLSSSAASVTFSSIPATYTDLVVRITARANNAANSTTLGVQFNSDTSTNYSYIFLTGNGSVVSSTLSGNFGTTYVGQMNSDSATASTFGSAELYVPSYTVSQNKPISGIGMSENDSAAAGGAVIRAVAGLWRNTAAITSMILTPTTGSFVSGSSFFLYGIKKS